MQLSSKNALRRLNGFVIVVNTLLPAVFVLLISVASIFLLPGPLEEIYNAASEMRDSAAAASTAVAAVAKNVNVYATNARNRLKGITKRVNNQTAKIDAAKTAIRNGLIASKIPKPFRKGLNNAFATVFRPFNAVADLSIEFQGIGNEIKKLDKLKPYFNRISTISGELVDRINSLSKWRGLLWFAFLVIAAWTAFSYFLWANRRLVMGISLMRGGVGGEGQA